MEYLQCNLNGRYDPLPYENLALFWLYYMKINQVYPSKQMIIDKNQNIEIESKLFWERSDN